MGTGMISHGTDKKTEVENVNNHVGQRQHKRYMLGILIPSLFTIYTIFKDKLYLFDVLELFQKNDVFF